MRDGLEAGQTRHALTVVAGDGGGEVEVEEGLAGDVGGGGRDHDIAEDEMVEGSGGKSSEGEEGGDAGGGESEGGDGVEGGSERFDEGSADAGDDDSATEGARWGWRGRLKMRGKAYSWWH